MQELNQSPAKNKTSLFLLGLLVIFIVSSIALAFWYFYNSYNTNQSKNDDTQTEAQFGAPVFDPTKDYQAVGLALKDRLSVTKKIDLEKLATVVSRLSNSNETIFHTGEVDLRYGGIVSEVSYNPTAVDEETALLLVITNLNNTDINYTASFTKRQINTMNVFLNIPNQAPQLIGPQDINTNDLVDIIETIDILESEREGYIAIEVQKPPKP